MDGHPPDLINKVSLKVHSLVLSCGLTEQGVSHMT